MISSPPSAAMTSDQRRSTAAIPTAQSNITAAHDGTKRAAIDPEIRAAIDDVIARGDFVLGRDVELFESEFATWCGARHCITVNSGADALRMLLRAYGVGPGDEVIMSGSAYIGTALAVATTGAAPVLVDHDPATWTINPDRVAATITRRVKAIIATHQFGHPADMEAIMSIAQTSGVPVIEDASLAHGAAVGGRRAGSLGDAAAFSFHPGSPLDAFGDGGAITTNNSELAVRLKARRNYGSVRRGIHQTPGCNSRLDTIQAAVLRVKLRRLVGRNERMRIVAGHLSRGLAPLGVRIPMQSPDASRVFGRYVIGAPRRDELLTGLQRRGIAAEAIWTAPIHKQHAFDNLPLRTADLASVENATQHGLSLPIHPDMTPRDIMQMVDTIRDILRGNTAETGTTRATTPHATSHTAPITTPITTDA